MTRLLVHVEGETEEAFSNEVLRPHLVTVGYSNVSARIIGNARLRAHRGGIQGWPHVKKEIVRHLKEDAGCVATTMVDYYAMPREGEKAWPGRAEAVAKPYEEKASSVETSLLEEIVSEMGDSFDKSRFIPYVVMHEFEGLLFSDCNAFARGIGRSDLAQPLQMIRNAFDTPEQINDSPVTAPSKRVELLMPGYQKPLLGNLAALEIGLNRIRKACPNFEAWMSKLETLAIP